jgi:hypothetical protein
MSPFDIAGVVGAIAFLVAYAGATTGRLDPKRAASLWLNFAGAGLILISLTSAFNLAAVIVEVAWGLIALTGLVRLAAAHLARRR